MNNRRARARSFYVKTKRSLRKLSQFFAGQHAPNIKLVKKNPQDSYDNALSSEGVSLSDNVLCFDYNNALSSAEVLPSSSEQAKNSQESEASCASSSLFSSINISLSSESENIVPRSNKEEAEQKLEIRLNLWIASSYDKENCYLSLSMIKDLVDKSPRSKLAHKFNEMRRAGSFMTEDNMSHIENKKPTL